MATTFDLENFPLTVSVGVDESSSADGDSTKKGPRQEPGARGGLVRSPGFDASHGGSFSGGEDVENGVGGGALLKGDLATRPKSVGDGDGDGDDAWKPAHYVLEKGRLLVFEDRHHVRPKQVGLVRVNDFVRSVFVAACFRSCSPEFPSSLLFCFGSCSFVPVLCVCSARLPSACCTPLR